ncbi:MAG: SUMF1/EgtB/PvdO family nonheme iron enzyme [Snowella sp.]|nr:SUMF1/EgtB/PvdO family nonheme iron enzyme [Snowella sp.]
MDKTIFPLPPRLTIAQALDACRLETLALFKNLDTELFCCQIHPDFSPIGWHLGHIAFTEAYWILEQCQGAEALFPQYRRLLTADGLPKRDRQHLPTFEIIQDYLQTVRQKILAYLDNAPLEKQERLWWWLIQHETQHRETISFLLELWRWQQGTQVQIPLISSSPLTIEPNLIEIPAGECILGSDRLQAQDNERVAHRVYLDSYQIDQYPVTNGQYLAFIETGGYDNPSYWSPAGWQWRIEQNITQPLYWRADRAWMNHPVCGVSYYEAEAYAQFVGKRLPTEAEWEKAASWDESDQEQRLYPWGDQFPDSAFCNHNYLLGQTSPVNHYPAGKSDYGCYDMLGNVWEWTASWFAPYGQFQPYPYPGYSQVYFDQQHRGLRGGSWATGPWGLRNSFRNWYHPWVRQILVGFRCAI